MKRSTLSLLLLLTITLNCQKEEEYWKTSNDFKFFVLREILWKQGHCPAPNLVLEKGVSYNVTLKAGERFWFDFKERQEAVLRTNLKFTLKVVKTAGATVVKRSVSCDFSPTAGESESDTPNGTEEVNFTIETYGGSKEGFFLEIQSGNHEIQLMHSNTQ